MKYQFKMESYDHKVPRKMNYRKDDKVKIMHMRKTTGILIRQY